MTEDQKGKIRFALKGRVVSPETREKLSLSLKGRGPSDNNRKATSKAMKGNKFAFGYHHTEETREKIRQSRLGKHLSEEAKRKVSESHSGEKSYMWRGGRSMEPYAKNWNSIAREIRKRDDYLCQYPGCYCSEMGRAHDVHHIDSDRNNNQADNLITLCRAHHRLATRGDEEYWMSFFDEVQKNRGIPVPFGYRRTGFLGN